MPSGRRCNNCNYRFATEEITCEYEGDIYCDSCMNDINNENNDDNNDNDDNSYRGINSYGYHPTPIFHYGDGTRNTRHVKTAENRYEPMMGIELETEQNGDEYLSKAVEYVQETASDLLYLKEDCSIRNGFEIVSHPMTLDYLHNHATQYRDVLDYLRTNNYRAWHASNCGLHIHISKKSFKDAKHEMKFLFFVYHNKKALVKFAGRDTHYARFDLDSFVGATGSPFDNQNNTKPTIMEVVKGVRKNGGYVPGQHERNLAVNRMNEDTHELRIFKPSLRFTTVLAYAEFVHSLFAYTEQVSLENVLKNKGLTTFTPLVNYAKTNPELYKNFIIKCEKKNVLRYELEGN